MTEAPPGLDLTRLADWLPPVLERAGVGLGRPGLGRAGLRLSATLIAGGRSNLTYEITGTYETTGTCETPGTGETAGGTGETPGGVRRWVLRRPPLGHVLATAHDMAREYRVMSALAGTAVPVPAMYGLCTDTGVLGVPFYLMEYVAGTPYRRAGQLAALGPDRTRAIALAMVDTLAALHRVDPAAVGLEDFGKPEGFLARQVARWKKQLDASYCRDLPAADELYRRLAAGVPPQSAPGIVHGDYRLDNILVGDSASQDRASQNRDRASEDRGRASQDRGRASQDRDRLNAVIDWEMATLGDPLTDLALMLVYHRMAARLGETVADASAAPGFPSEREIIERYAQGSDRDLSAFGFYLGLASYKLAVILEGIHYRYLHGQTVGPGFENIGPGIYPLLEEGLAALKE